MVRPLRRAHFWIWTCLSVLMAGLLIAAIALRPLPPAPNPDLPTEWKP